MTMVSPIPQITSGTLSREHLMVLPASFILMEHFKPPTPVALYLQAITRLELVPLMVSIKSLREVLTTCASTTEHYLQAKFFNCITSAGNITFAPYQIRLLIATGQASIPPVRNQISNGASRAVYPVKLERSESFNWGRRGGGGGTFSKKREKNKKKKFNFLSL